MYVLSISSVSEVMMVPTVRIKILSVSTKVGPMLANVRVIAGGPFLTSPLGKKFNPQGWTVTPRGAVPKV
jgi:hypothetical protein